MRNFRDQLERDLNVFHHGLEFAEKLTITIDGKDYTGMFVVEVDETSNREKIESDHIDSLNTTNLTVYIPLKALEKVPRKGCEVFFEEDFFQIKKVVEEMGEVILSLEGVTE